MLKRQDKIWNKVDWLTVLIFFALVFVGWLNIVASVYDGESSIFSFNLNSGKQLLWIGASICLIIVIMTVDFKTYESLSYLIYGVFLATLLLVLIFGREISGARSWFQFGGFGLQPSEFAKFATALALAKYMSDHPVKFEKLKDYLMLGLIIGLPMALILLQPDAGTAMVFGSLVIVLYREGLNPTVIIIGIIAALLFVLTLFVEQLTLIISITVLTLLVVGIIIGIGVKTRKRITAAAAMPPTHDGRIINRRFDSFCHSRSIKYSRFARKTLSDSLLSFSANSCRAQDFREPGCGRRRVLTFPPPAARFLRDNIFPVAL